MGEEAEAEAARLEEEGGEADEEEDEPQLPPELEGMTVESHCMFDL